MYNLNWKKDGLTKQKLGVFGEYYAKMSFLSYGISIYTTEIDDHGIDFIAETKKGLFKIQVKTIRNGTRYIYVRKKYFDCLDPNLYLFVVLLINDKPPFLYLIPSSAWHNEDEKVFVYYDYKGKKSKPEYGINLSKRNLHYLEKYKMENVINQWQ